MTGKLRARLESAKGILKNLTEALVETKERLVDLEMQLSRSPRAYSLDLQMQMLVDLEMQMLVDLEMLRSRSFRAY